MRDRLVGLLRDTFNYTKGVCIDFDEAVEINADYLLANGVIVPPCKVGDKIYRLNRLCSSFNEATVKAFYLTEDKKYYPKPHMIIQYDLARGRLRVNLSEIGKTVFLTKNQAEQALAKMKGGAEG